MKFPIWLNAELARRLARVANARRVSKSELIRQCLEKYLPDTEDQPSAWELGKHLFGCFNSGHGDLSIRAKDIAREHILAKHARRKGR
jgi:hypothetical protein